MLTPGRTARKGGRMRRTRPVMALLLAAATLVALALGGAAVAAADEPANRGWSSPIGAVEEFGGR